MAPKNEVKMYFASIIPLMIIGIVVAYFSVPPGASLIFPLLLGGLLGGLVGFLCAFTVNKHHRVKYNL